MINSLNDTMQACKNAVGEEGCDSRLECGAKRPSDPALVLLKVIRCKDIKTVPYKTGASAQFSIVGFARK
jgi:hypothetical protein